MSEAEKGRAATEFRSIVDGPTVDEVVNMEDDVFDNNERADQQNDKNDKNDQQNDKGDKNKVTNPIPHPPLQVKRSRGRPRKCRSLGSLGSTPDPEKLRKPSKKQSNGKKIFP